MSCPGILGGWLPLILLAGSLLTPSGDQSPEACALSLTRQCRAAGLWDYVL
jgi:hypothetical protein